MWGGWKGVHLFLQASTFYLLQTSAVTWTWNLFNASQLHRDDIHLPLPLRNRNLDDTYPSREEPTG